MAKISDWWSAKQAQTAVDKKLAQGKSEFRAERDPYGRRVMHFIDPDTGDYYEGEYEEEGDPFPDLMDRAVKKAIKRTELEKAQHDAWLKEQRRLQQGEVEAGREYCLKQRLLAEERGDQAAICFWQNKLAELVKQGPAEWRYPDMPGEWEEADTQRVAADTQRVAAPENRIKATIHKDGHFPTRWIAEAIDRAEQSLKAITFAIEREGIVVTAMEAGERFAVKVSDWQAMEHSQVNPLIHAIEEVEHKLDILQDLKAKVA